MDSFLFERRVNVTQATALVIASYKGRTGVVRLLLDLKARLEQVSEGHS